MTKGLIFFLVIHFIISQIHVSYYFLVFYWIWEYKMYKKKETVTVNSIP